VVGLPSVVAARAAWFKDKNMAKQNARLKDPSDATVEGGMRRGVNVGNMKMLKKPMTMRGGGAAKKGLKISEKQG
jgi:hypothetical protein